MATRRETIDGVRVVLLDAGGTLIDLDPDRLAAALEPLGIVPDEPSIRRAEGPARRWADRAVRRGIEPRDLWDGYFGRVLAGAGVPPDRVPRALERLWEANRRDGLWRRPVPGARETLARLREAGLRLAVVSNAEGQVEADLRDAGFADLLDLVIDSHLVGVAKPDPGIFRVALERLGAAPGACVHVGDVPAYDVEGARAAGITPVLVDRWEAWPDAGCARIREIAELPPLLGA